MAQPASTEAPGLDPRRFRDVMGHFATGVTVVTYRHGEDTLGMTANAFMSVSLDPPLACLSVRRKARFAAAVGLGDRYGVNFLLESQETLSNHFGGRPAAGLEPRFGSLGGAPTLDGSLAQLVLRTVAIHEAGDHLLHLGRVEHLEQLVMGAQRKPLVFYSGAYQQVNLHTAPRMFWAAQDGW